MAAASTTKSSSGSTRTRDRNRRDKILRAAARLFRERGFHAVGIDEIGTAAGITGPGVYRHFAGKDELLVCVLEEAAERVWDLDPLVPDERDATLEDHVRAHVAYSLEHRDAIDLWYRERRHLPPDAEQSQRRAQRRYVERWVELLLARRPELAAAEARVMVLAVLALLHSAGASRRGVDADVLAARLERMALAAFDA